MNGSRLGDSRRAGFVGRAAEIALFQDAVTQPEPPFAVVYLHAPGGVGKTSLLRALANESAALNANAVYLDAGGLDARAPKDMPALFLTGLRELVAGELATRDTPGEGADCLECFWRDLMQSRGAARWVLFVDTYEQLAPIDDWIRTAFIASMPDSVMLVLGGRNPPTTAWRSDPAWGSLIRQISLRNFSPDESLAFLRARAVREIQHDPVMNFTHGHPLALSLVADILARQENHQAFAPEAMPEVLRALLDRLVQGVPSPMHRAALEACALARVMNEPLLCAMLNLPAQSGAQDDEVPALFGWLRDQSFVGSGRHGIFLRDIEREALAADLRWRNPDWHATLHDRAHAQQRLLAGGEKSARAAALSALEFAAGIRHALRDYTRPDLMRGNPLLGCGLVLDTMVAAAPLSERVSALCKIIAGAIASLTAHPRDARLARVLDMTYLHPAGTQESTAERLNLPFSSYRRYLQTGVLRVTEYLWDREEGR